MSIKVSNWAVAGLVSLGLILAIARFEMSGSATDMDAVTNELVMVILKPKRPPASGEMLAVDVEVAALEFGSDIVVADGSGTVIGGVSPFGRAARQGPSKTLIPLPVGISGSDEITLQFWIVEAGTDKRRAPAKDELLSVELVYVPVRSD